MKDRIPKEILANGAIRYGEYAANGNPIGYRYLRPEDDPTEEGTPLNKATLFSDQTAVLYGLEGEEATPDRALRKLYDSIFEVGDIRTTTRESPGENWHVCDGTEFDPAAYPRLAEALPRDVYDADSWSAVRSAAGIVRPSHEGLWCYAADNANQKLRFYLSRDGKTWEEGTAMDHPGNNLYAVSYCNGYYLVLYKGSDARLKLAWTAALKGIWTVYSSNVTQVLYDGTVLVGGGGWHYIISDAYISDYDHVVYAFNGLNGFKNLSRTYNTRSTDNDTWDRVRLAYCDENGGFVAYYGSNADRLLYGKGTAISYFTAGGSYKINGALSNKAGKIYLYGSYSYSNGNTDRAVLIFDTGANTMTSEVGAADFAFDSAFPPSWYDGTYYYAIVGDNYTNPSHLSAVKLVRSRSYRMTDSEEFAIHSPSGSENLKGITATNTNKPSFWLQPDAGGNFGMWASVEGQYQYVANMLPQITPSGRAKAFIKMKEIYES